MAENSLPEDLGNYRFFLVGIKGTGMTALAELLQHHGAKVTGSDVPEVFYTDAILKAINISIIEDFAADVITDQFDFVIHSSAYDRETHPQLLRARSLGIPVFNYSEALGQYSSHVPTAAIAGVHGKTTTTALAGCLLKAFRLPGAVLAGSGISDFGGRSTFFEGSAAFIAETCEYKRNFLHFSPQWLVITSVEEDHLDYFKDLDDIISAFVELGKKVADGGTIIYCGDDSGASEAARQIVEYHTLHKKQRLKTISYGFGKKYDANIEYAGVAGGFQRFFVHGISQEFMLPVPGEHLVLNATAALILNKEILEFLMPKDHDSGSSMDKDKKKRDEIYKKASAAFAGFKGAKRRSEIIGEARGILIIDDYGHHPTAIKKTLQGYREFYPDRRIIVDFMSHTYSRTQALLEDFVTAFDDVDAVMLHKIYASAREQAGAVTGETLFEKIAARRNNVFFENEPLEAVPFLLSYLREGDVFITMGAGNNWPVGVELLNKLNQGIAV